MTTQPIHPSQCLLSPTYKNGASFITLPRRGCCAAVAALGTSPHPSIPIVRPCRPPAPGNPPPWRSSPQGLNKPVPSMARTYGRVPLLAGHSVVYRRDGRPRAPSITVIVAILSWSSSAAKARQQTIPIVFSSGSDPVNSALSQVLQTDRQQRHWHAVLTPCSRRST